MHTQFLYKATTERKDVQSISNIAHFICFLLVLLCLPAAIVYGQGIDNTATYRNIPGDRYFRLSYDNDFFAAKDQYYTQGIDAELVFPALGNTFLRRILFHLPEGNSRYGLGVQHNGYTPASISSDDILYGDHPFAGVLMAKAFVVSDNGVRNHRLSSQLSVGVIGPAAGAAEMQLYIHDKLNNITPHGWEHQISNDWVVNYAVNYERRLTGIDKYFLLSGGAGANLGTLNSSGNAGLTIMAGYFASPYSPGEESSRGKLSVYCFLKPTGTIVAYDGTLQGGLFNDLSPYTISPPNVSRFIFGNRYGVALSWKGLYLEYFKAFSTRQFVTGNDYMYGGIQIGVRL